MADQDADGYEEANFPGLNKRHGFFKAIERNQRARDHYHQEWESRQGEVKKEWRQTKRRPPKDLYCPPHTRGERKTALYRLEIEVVPYQWHRQTVKKFGQSEKIASELLVKYQLTELQRQALEEMITEFEQSLDV